MHLLEIDDRDFGEEILDRRWGGAGRGDEMLREEELQQGKDELRLMGGVDEDGGGGGLGGNVRDEALGEGEEGRQSRKVACQRDSQLAFASTLQQSSTHRGRPLGHRSSRVRLAERTRFEFGTERIGRTQLRSR